MAPSVLLVALTLAIADGFAVQPGPLRPISRPPRPFFQAAHALQPRTSTPTALALPITAASLDLPCALASWGLIAAYNFISAKANSAWASQNADGRAVWTRYILEKGDYILGVQTLRNALTSASFFASACFTCLSLLAGSAMRASSLPRLAIAKYASVAVLLVCSALSYLQSVRYMNSCAFLFQVANDQRDGTCSRGTVMLLMVLSQNCWSAGERFIYLLVPSVMWLVGGGLAMLGTTILLLPVLYYKDLPAPTNLLGQDEPSLKPYAYMLQGPLKFLDIFGFGTALSVAQRTVAESGEYAKEKYGLESATWPPPKP